MRRWRGAAVLAALAATVACIDFTVDGDALGSLEFVPPAFPSIDAGDTLRDSLAQVAPLRGMVYRADGRPDSDAPVQFTLVGSGTGARIVGNLLVADPLGADSTSRTIAVIASTGSLQSQIRTMLVVRRPVSYTIEGDSVRNIFYRLFPLPSDTFPELKVNLRYASAANAGVPGYITRFSIRRGLTVLPATDTTQSYWLTDTQGRPSAVDTTGTLGDASRRLMFRLRSGQVPIDSSVRVVAEVRPARRGEPVRSVSWRILVQPAR